jgi:hypothetical protein
MVRDQEVGGSNPLALQILLMRSPIAYLRANLRIERPENRYPGKA